MLLAKAVSTQRSPASTPITRLARDSTGNRWQNPASARGLGIQMYCWVRGLARVISSAVHWAHQGACRCGPVPLWLTLRSPAVLAARSESGLPGVPWMRWPAPKARPVSGIVNPECSTRGASCVAAQCAAGAVVSQMIQLPGAAVRFDAPVSAIVRALARWARAQAVDLPVWSRERACVAQRAGVSAPVRCC